MGSWGIAGVRCKIRSGWEDAGREGEAYSWMTPRNGSQRRVAVVWDDEDYPEFFKASGLLFKHHGSRNWVDEKLDDL
jgi:hypothetical protein